jgi:hypothetical protein
MAHALVRFAPPCGALAFLLATLPLAARGQTVTGNIRGRLTEPSGSAVVSARVTATNIETGVPRSTLADADGRYRLLGLSPGNYRVRAQAIGHRSLEKTGYRVQIGDELIVDFILEPAAVEVAAVPVVVEATPLVDAGKTGVSRTVSEAEVANLPANGRNFTDFIALAPTFVSTPKFGSGGSIGVLGGSRNSGTILNIDGVENTGSFFGGDARGGDRLPIAFSIESVKEFQVLTNEYDVSKGGFTGGLVNAVTKSGTNEVRGSVFEYFRDHDLTRDDFLGNPPQDFLSHQFGATVSGPIVRDRAHFLLAVDRQARRAPATAVTSNVLGVPDSTLNRLDNIIRTVYGVDPGPRGTVNIEVNEWALFGRVDVNLSNRHRLAIRDNLTVLDLVGDRISTGSGNQYDYFSNGGPQKPKVNSLAANLFSNLTSSLYNELRLQYSTDPKPRPPQVTYPQVRVFLGGHFVAFGADSILHFNDLKENTFQIADAATFTRGAHSVQLGFDVLRKSFFNLFFNNGRGTYTFNWGADSPTLDSLAARHASAFTRAVPFSAVSPVQFPDSIPTADYVGWRYSFFLQDRWQPTRQLTLTAGVRVDVPKVRNVPRNNATLLDSFPQFFLDAAGISRLRGGTASAADSLTTAREVPAAYNWQPRVGFAYDVFGDQRTVVRGGVGTFYGYTPFVYWSNMFLNTGRDQLNVVCAANTPAAQNVNLTVDAPANCGPLTPPAANAFFFTTRDPVTGAPKAFKTPVAFKTNFGIDHGVTPNVRVGAEVSYAKTWHNYSIRDINYRSDVTAVLAGEGGRVVVGTAPGASGSSARRIDPRFIQVLEHDNRSRGDYVALIPSVTWRHPRWDVSASYTYSRSRDDVSISCCTSTTTYRLVEAGVNTNNQLDGDFSFSDNDRPNLFVLSGLWRGPYGINVGALLRAYSGLPFSPTINSANDANGDGIRGNDRAYIPRDRNDITIDANGAAAGLGSPLQQDSAYAVLDAIINRNACLASQRGRIAQRNTCRNPARTVLDLRVSKEVTTVRGQSVELVADFFNLLNGINKNWGRATSAQTSLMRIRGFDAANNRYIYEVDSKFGQEFLETGADLAQFQAQLGVRYTF